MPQLTMRSSRAARAGKPRLPPRRFYGLLCGLAIACAEREKSIGTYTLTGEGGLTVTMRGPAEASYEPILSGRSGRDFNVTLDLANGTPPLAGFSYLTIWPKARPTPGSVYSSGRGVRDTTDGRQRARMSLGETSGAVSPWLPDSGTAEFTASDRHGLAGIVMLFLHCRECSATNGPTTAILRGRFSTHD